MTNFLDTPNYLALSQETTQSPSRFLSFFFQADSFEVSVYAIWLPATGPRTLAGCTAFCCTTWPKAYYLVKMHSSWHLGCFRTSANQPSMWRLSYQKYNCTSLEGPPFSRSYNDTISQGQVVAPSRLSRWWFLVLLCIVHAWWNATDLLDAGPIKQHDVAPRQKQWGFLRVPAGTFQCGRINGHRVNKGRSRGEIS